MEKKNTIILGSLGIVSAFLINFLTPLSTHALSLTIEQGASAARGVDQAETLFGASGIFTTLSNFMLFIVGALSVIMIIVGGLRYVISGGDNSNVTSAKNTILYAVVGLVVSMLAYAAINFVITSFLPDSNGVGTNF